MSEFEGLWKYVMDRSQHGVMTVQERHELKHVFNLMKDCSSYLEIGTAEGNSLYVLSHAVKSGGRIDYVDLGEPHTEKARLEVIELIKDRKVKGYFGDSRDKNTLPNPGQYDCVMIDGGHSYDNVLADARNYGHLATKYLFFHDIQLVSVKAAVEGYRQLFPDVPYSEFINSQSFGYGVFKCH